MWVLLAVLLIGALLAIARLLARASRIQETRRESPREIVARRYATGEIDEETYRRMLSELGGQPLTDGNGLNQ